MDLNKGMLCGLAKINCLNEEEEKLFRSYAKLLVSHKQVADLTEEEVDLHFQVFRHPNASKAVQRAIRQLVHVLSPSDTSTEGLFFNLILSTCD